jgi:hypothetical protein
METLRDSIEADPALAVNAGQGFPQRQQAIR